ncbi:hypothetical protein DFQ10_10396 [Winogradskyella eximia]|jgi:hypothetical protein|uniref:Uncharacterized protein n=1 Tax=Winogradskyella eximia TaxID=262006 RepID=A0A3D9H4J0_9FLAO|nr:hypothetical protein DFQ10_10396 [Winogradskyella eximia]
MKPTAKAKWNIANLTERKLLQNGKSRSKRIT